MSFLYDLCPIITPLYYWNWRLSCWAKCRMGEWTGVDTPVMTTRAPIVLKTTLYMYMEKRVDKSDLTSASFTSPPSETCRIKINMPCYCMTSYRGWCSIWSTLNDKVKVIERQPRTSSSNCLLVKRTPAQKPSKLYLENLRSARSCEIIIMTLGSVQCSG